jgi:hypothetical protein
MSLQTKEDREAVRTFHEMVVLGCLLESRTLRREVGAVTRLLSAERRAKLKYLKSKHTQDRIK